MGAASFVVVSKGKNADEAFDNAVSDAYSQHGNAGYTGSIAEKPGFVLIDLPAEYKSTPFTYISDLIDNDDPRIEDKWGLAGCIDAGLGEYIFFGWAST